MLDPVRNQGLHEGDEARHHLLAGGIVRIRPAEEVDRLQLVRMRPRLDRVEIVQCPGLVGNRVYRLGGIQQTQPLRSRALPLFQHPPGARKLPVVDRLGPGPRRLEQGRAPPGAHRGPAGAGGDDVSLVVRDQRQGAGHRHATQECPLLRAERLVAPVQEQDLGRARAQQTRFEPRLRGRIEAVEPERGVMVMECLVVSARDLLAVADEPELGLRLGTGEICDAPVEDGPLRLPAARELQRVAGVAFASLRPLQGGDQCSGLDVSVRQPIGEGPARGDELRLPGDGVPGVRQVVPPGIAVEGVVLVDVGDQQPRRAVVEADASERYLSERDGKLASFVRSGQVVDASPRNDR